MNKNELIYKLEELKVDKRAYSLDGEINDNSYVIYQNYNKWEFFYFERGERIEEKIFLSEDSAYDYLYEILKNDLTTRES